MTSVSDIWQVLLSKGDFGGARRVDEDLSADLYAALDAAGKPGILVITDVEPPNIPELTALQVGRGQRSDGRWMLGLWLKEPTLRHIFALLCDDLVQAVRPGVGRELGRVVVERLMRWRRLLEPAKSQLLSDEALRGLVGELCLLRWLSARRSVAEAVLAWQGPFDAAQDFALSNLLVEVKTVRPTATNFRVASLQQLDPVAPLPLWLAMVPLANDASDDPPAFSPAAIVRELRHAFSGDPTTTLEFDSRLQSAGFSEDPLYEQVFFHLGGIRFFAVQAGFPRLARRETDPGILEATYTVGIHALLSFEVDGVLP